VLIAASDPDRHEVIVASDWVSSDRPQGVNSGGAAADIPAKLLVPVATRVISRPRLHALLATGLHYPVTVVAAAAGWGKTLLAASWVAAGSGGRAAAWVSLDEGDDDPDTFWRMLATALLPIAGPECGAELRAMAAQPADAEDLPRAFAAAVRSAARPLLLVLDSLHEVSSPAVHAGLLRLIERPLPMLSLLVTTRRDPPWPLTRLRLAGLVAEVRVEDLAFHDEEAAALFAQLHVDLTQAQVARLVERTEGWPAGLRLVALHLQGRADIDGAVDAFSGDDHSVAGYLLTEVLDQQAPELIAFLQKISAVELVCADLADALTGRRDSAEVLTGLFASHLFVQAVDRRGRWYRLHRLIADVLRARPTARRERRDLQRRAAQWYRNNGMPLDAIAAAAAGEHWPLAAELVGAHMFAISLRGTARALERRLAAVPRSTVVAFPELAAGLAGARVVQGDDTDVAELLDAARAGTANLPGRRAARAGVLIDVVAGGFARLTGDWDAAATIYRGVPVDLVTLAGLGIADAEIVPATVDNILGSAALWEGDLARAERYLRAAVAAELPSRTVSQLNAAAYLTFLRCERGELDPAEAEARRVVSAASAAGLGRTAQAVGAYLALARIYLDRGDWSGVEEWLGRVAEVESVAPEPHVRLAAALVLAGRHEAAGDREQALSDVRVAAMNGWSPPTALREQWLAAEAGLLARSRASAGVGRVLEDLQAARTATGMIASARLLLVLGDRPGAVAVRAHIDVPDHPRGRVDTALLDALIAAADGDEEAALDRLETALAAAVPWGLRWAFLAEGAQLKALLTERVGRGTVAPAFALDLLERMSAGASSEVDARRALVEPLTDRERTVLRYLSGSLSNTEIAAALYISVNTLKTHEGAVYRKLRAANRRDAVRRARALHLL
jgi:LuxR family transcriptional regulator, maltose regulon positive regulatory protein